MNMNMNMKLFAIILAVSFLLCGCAGTKDAKPGTTDNPTTAPADSENTSVPEETEFEFTLPFSHPDATLPVDWFE